MSERAQRPTKPTRTPEAEARARSVRVLCDMASHVLRHLADALDEAGDTPHEAKMMTATVERIAETYKR